MATGGAMYGMLGAISFKTVRLEKMPDLKASMKWGGHVLHLMPTTLGNWKSGFIENKGEENITRGSTKNNRKFADYRLWGSEGREEGFEDLETGDWVRKWKSKEPYGVKVQREKLSQESWAFLYKRHEINPHGSQAVRGRERGGEGSGTFPRTGGALEPSPPSCRWRCEGLGSRGLLQSTQRCEWHFILLIFFYLQVPSFCSDADDIDCRLEDLTKKYCLEYNYDYENGFAIGN